MLIFSPGDSLMLVVVTQPSLILLGFLRGNNKGLKDRSDIT